jgi:hypothetical protein
LTESGRAASKAGAEAKQDAAKPAHEARKLVEEAEREAAVGVSRERNKSKISI